MDIMDKVKEGPDDIQWHMKVWEPLAESVKM